MSDLVIGAVTSLGGYFLGRTIANLIRYGEVFPEMVPLKKAKAMCDQASLERHRALREAYRKLNGDPVQAEQEKMIAHVSELTGQELSHHA